MSKLINKLTPSNYLQFFQIARYGGLFLSGVLLAKCGVSIPVIGQYEFILFISGLLSFFWMGGIFQTLFSEFHQQENPNNFLEKTIGTVTTLSLTSALLALIYLQLLDHKNSFSCTTIIATTIYLFLNTVTFFNENFYLLKERYKQLTLYAIGNFCIQVLAVLLTIIMNPTIENFSLALLFISIWKSVILLYNLKSEKIKISLTLYKPLLKMSSPLIAGILISGSADYIDSFMVIHFFGNESFAIFKYGAKEFPLSLLLANSLSMAMIPTLSRSEKLQESLKDLKVQSSRLMSILFPITWLFLLLSHWIYPFIFNEHFSQSASIFNIYLLLIISRMIFPQTVLLAMQRRETILNTAYWEIIINVISSYLFMLKFGIIGIAYGTVIAFLSEKLLLAYQLKKLNTDFQSYTNTARWFLFVIITILTYIFVENFL
ncbi:MAG: polysaccharide biosynthesis C-terminal domain-containing protein [Bacteroidota bacterium]